MRDGLGISDASRSDLRDDVARRCHAAGRDPIREPTGGVAIGLRGVECPDAPAPCRIQDRKAVVTVRNVSRGLAAVRKPELHGPEDDPFDALRWRPAHLEKCRDD